jgi:hypothetical protein
MLAAVRMTLLHFSVSSMRSLPKSAAPPTSAILAFILGSAITAMISLFSRSMSSTEVLFGTPSSHLRHAARGSHPSLLPAGVRAKIATSDLSNRLAQMLHPGTKIRGFEGLGVGVICLLFTTRRSFNGSAQWGPKVLGAVSHVRLQLAYCQVSTS